MSRKNTKPYFPHEADSRNRESMIRLRIAHGPAGYGVYYMLLERLRMEETYQATFDLEILAFDLKTDEELIRSVITDFGLFVVSEDGKTFTSVELSEYMTFMEEAKQRRQEAARKAAEARWGTVRESKSGSPVPQASPEVRDNKREELDNKTLVPLARLDKEWTESIMRKYGLDSDGLDSKINSFVESCQREGRPTSKSTQDFKSHFNRWLGKQSFEAVSSSKQSNVSQKDDSEKRFLAATARNRKEIDKEENLRKIEQSRQRQNTSKAENDLWVRSKGYDPEKVTWAMVMNPNWTDNNPPTLPLIPINELKAAKTAT